VAHPKLRQLLMADVHVAGDPPVRHVATDQAGDLTRTAHRLRQRVQPQGQQHPRTLQRPSRRPFDRLAPLAEGCQLHLPQHVPDHPSGMRRLQRILGELESHFPLRSLRLLNSRHAASAGPLRTPLTGRPLKQRQRFLHTPFDPYRDRRQEKSSAYPISGHLLSAKLAPRPRPRPPTRRTIEALSQDDSSRRPDRELESAGREADSQACACCTCVASAVTGAAVTSA
jgi:hypothetical protein